MANKNKDVTLNVRIATNFVKTGWEDFEDKILIPLEKLGSVEFSPKLANNSKFQDTIKKFRDGYEDIFATLGEGTEKLSEKELASTVTKFKELSRELLKVKDLAKSGIKIDLNTTEEVQNLKKIEEQLNAAKTALEKYQNEKNNPVKRQTAKSEFSDVNAITTVDELKNKYKELQAELDRFNSSSIVNEKVLSDLDTLEKKIANIQAIAKKSNVDLNQEGQDEELKELVATYESLEKQQEDQVDLVNKQKQAYNNLFIQLEEVFVYMKNTLEAINKGQPLPEEMPKCLSEINREVKNMGENSKGPLDNFASQLISAQFVVSKLREAIVQTYETIKKLDSAFNEIAVVTSYTTDQVWGMYDAFENIARRVGTTTSDVAKIAGEYFKQGKSYQEALVLSEAAATSAKIAGISAAESVQYLTSALNGYNLSADKAYEVSDKFALLAAKSATDYSDLAIALSKVAAQAANVGVNMDNMMGFLATALETTQEAPENIGTAFKTIFARMSEIKNFGATLDDMTDANKIETALGSIGVELFDVTGAMRNLDDVLIEVGKKWKDLTTNQRTYLATAIAGTRQQTRLISVFQDFDRTMELAEASANSLGATLAQHSKTTESIDYAVANLTTAWEGLINSLSNSDTVINIINALTNLVQLLDTAPGRMAIFSTGAVGMAAVLDTGVTKLKDWTTGLKTSSGLFANLVGLFPKVKDLAVKAGSSILGWAKSLFTAKTATGALTVAQTGLNVVMKASPWIALAGGAIALVGALFKFTKQAEKAKVAVKDLNTEFYNIDIRANDINSLINKYQQLYVKINKSTEELDEMNSIMGQISDLEPNVDFFKADNSVDTQALANYQKDVNDQLVKNMEQQVKSANDILKRYNFDYSKAWENSDEAERAALKMNVALEAAGTSVEEFYKLSSEQMSQYLRYAEIQLKSFETTRQTVMKPVTLTVPSNAANAGLTQDNAGSQTIQLQQQTTALYSSEKIAEMANEISEALRQIVFSPEFDFNTPENFDNLQKAFKEMTSQLEELEIDDNLKSIIYNSFIQSIPYLDAMEVLTLMGISGADFAAALESGFSTESFTQIGNVILDFVNNDGALAKSMMVHLKDFLLDPTDTANFQNALITLQNEFGLTELEARTMVKNIQNQMEALNAVDLSHVVTSFQNTAKEISSINNMMKGEMNFTTLSNFMQANAQYAEQIAQDLINTGQISEAVANQIIASNKEATTQQLLDQKALNEAKIAEAEAQLEIVQQALNGQYDANVDYVSAVVGLKDEELTAEEAAANERIGLVTQEVQEEIKLWNAAAQARANAFGTAYEPATLDATANSVKACRADLAELNRQVNSNKEAFDYLQQNGAAAIEQLKAKIQSLVASNASIDVILAQLSNPEWINGLMGVGNAVQDSAGSAGEAAKEAVEALEDYERQLNAVYIATQRLETVTSKLDLNQAYMDLYDATDGEQWVYAWAERLDLLEQQNEAYKNLIQSQQEEQKRLLENSSAAHAFRVENGRLIPIMEAYNALSNEDAKAADELADAYNNLSGEIESNTVAMVENQSAIKELYDERRDKTIELQELLIEAIRAEQKAIFEEAKAGLEKEIELLEKRKKAYQDAFSEEDYQNDLNDIDVERQNVMTQLSGLEGASDLSSQKKRKELLEKLEELNKQYNDRTTEYNRDALLQQVDDEIAASEEKMEILEQEYEDRINDYEWLEEQIQAITQQGGDAVMAYLKTWHEDYINGTTLMKERTAEQWQILVDQVLTEANRSATGNRDSLNSIVGDTFNATKQLVDMWNSVAAARAAALATAAPTPSASPTKQPVHKGTIYTTTPEKKPGWHNSGGNLTWTGSGYGGGHVMVAYANGGEISHTGPAWVDGTSARPERILSAEQNKSFMSLVDILERSQQLPQSSNDSDITIEKIEISTNSLNTNQDFNQAGRVLASAFQKAINSRGISINQKK